MNNSSMTKFVEVDASINEASDDSELDVSQDQWIQRGMRRLSPSSVILETWDLKFPNSISIIAMDMGLRIHISDFVRNSENLQFISENDVIMSTETYFYLSTKIFNFNLTEAETSFVCNNKLLVVNCEGHCYLQQLLREEDGLQFKLNPQGIKLFPEQVGYLKMHMCEITEKVMSFQFETLLPKLILRAKGARCVFHIHEVEESAASENLLQVLHMELCSVTNRLLKCDACLIDHPSQFRHSCMTLSSCSKLFQAPSNCFSLINFSDAVKDLKNRFCLCKYTKKFFNDKKIDFYREGLTKVADSECDVLP